MFEFCISNSSLSPLFKGRGALHTYSKSYKRKFKLLQKGDLIHCKERLNALQKRIPMHYEGEAQHIPPRRRGEVRRGVLSINSAEKVRNAPSK